MLELRIKEAAKEKGVKNYYQLARLLDTENTGNIKFEVQARRLWAGNTNPTFKTMEAVCAALGCKFEDLIKQTNGKAAAKRSTKRKRR